MMLHDALDDIDNCMLSVILNENPLSPQCKFKQMEKRNYFVQLTAHTVYCCIIKPIQFRIDCNGYEQIYNLTKNTEIDFSDYCDYHKVLNELHYDSETFSMAETNNIFFKPNFSIYNEQSNNWTNDVEFYNQYNITLTKLLNKTDEMDDTLQKDITITSNEIESWPSKMWSGIENFFSYISSQIYLSLFMYLFLPIFISILIFLLCVHYAKK